jgi:hypothetical protein
MYQIFDVTRTSSLPSSLVIDEQSIYESLLLIPVLRYFISSGMSFYLDASS